MSGCGVGSRGCGVGSEGCGFGVFLILYLYSSSCSVHDYVSSLPRSAVTAPLLSCSVLPSYCFCGVVGLCMASKDRAVLCCSILIHI